MKADKSGSWDEQVRYANGWLSASLNTTGDYCKQCDHKAADRFYCEGLEIRTGANAVCHHFMPREEQS